MLENFKNENVLVTGGAGFVGSNLVNKLIELGAKVTVLDDLFTGNYYENLEHLKDNKNFNFIEGDVRDTQLIKDIVGDYDYVFHLAARNIIVSTKNIKEDFAVNIGGTLNILEELKLNPGRLKRFVYTGSVSIFGNTRYLPINEDDNINLLSPYSVSKLGGENYTKIYYENYNLPTTVVRYSNVYGTNQTPNNPYCGVIGKMIANVSQGKKCIVHGDGEQTRDFTFVEDAVEATLLSALSTNSVGEVFNIGSGVETSINRLAEEIMLVYTNLDDTCKNIDGIEYVDKRDIDNIRRRVLNIEKIRQRIKWVPRYTLRSGLNKTIDWYEKNK